MISHHRTAIKNGSLLRRYSKPPAEGCHLSACFGLLPNKQPLRQPVPSRPDTIRFTQLPANQGADCRLVKEGLAAAPPRFPLLPLHYRRLPRLFSCPVSLASSTPAFRTDRPAVASSSRSVDSLSGKTVEGRPRKRKIRIFGSEKTPSQCVLSNHLNAMTTTHLMIIRIVIRAFRHAFEAPPVDLKERK